MKLVLKVEAPDFAPACQQKELSVPPRGDSEPCVFFLIPQRLGKLLVNLEVSDTEQVRSRCLLRAEGINADASAVFKPRIQASVRMVAEDDVAEPATMAEAVDEVDHRKRLEAINVLDYEMEAAFEVCVVEDSESPRSLDIMPSARAISTSECAVDDGNCHDGFVDHGGRGKITSVVPVPGTHRVNTRDGSEYIWVPPGGFVMGAVLGDHEARKDENPRHPVQMSKGFWLRKTPVTVAAYKRFSQETGRTMPDPPVFNRTWEKEDHPIVNVSWHDAKAYCQWTGGRLPTEAEWEYAARGGKNGLKYPWGNTINPGRANYGRYGTTPVTEFPPQNHWELYDLAGNVSEWVADWYDAKYYRTLSLDHPIQDPPGSADGSRRALRGGSWNLITSASLRISARLSDNPEHRLYYIGFRCAMDEMG
jgi:formylglycine-generating enzyme required for sulfatase activity